MQDFIIEHTGIILAMIIPWIIRKPKCDGLLDEISTIIQKDVNTMLSNAVLQIYLHSFLNENEDVQKSIQKFLLAKTEITLYDLLKLDINVSSINILLYSINAINNNLILNFSDGCFWFL